VGNPAEETCCHPNIHTIGFCDFLSTLSHILSHIREKVWIGKEGRHEGIM